MKLLRKRLTGFTAIKYFLSYLILLSVLIVGFFFITKKQISESYFEYRSDQALSQLSSLATQFNEELIYLSQVDSEIVSDLELIEGRYKEANAYNYHSLTELREYCATAKIISSIVYMPKKADVPLSTHLPVSYKDGLFYITDASMKTIAFDPNPYFDSSFGQLVFISNDTVQHLIYFPSINRQSNYIFFYLLDTGDLQQRFKGITSEEILSISLVDEHSQIVLGVNSDQMFPYLQEGAYEDGVYQKDNSTFLCVRSGINRRFSMMCLLSRDFLINRINEAFAESYLALLMLSAFGFLLVLLAMRITYLPLHKLTQKIIPNADSRQGYLNQIESAFSEAESQNQLLQGKLENYRLSLQKSLLDSIVISQSPGMDIDQLFNHRSQSKIFIIRLHAPNMGCSPDNIQEILTSMLPDNTSCITLEQKESVAVLLINYTGSTQNKDEQLQNMCTRLHDEHGYMVAISNGSESPLDIPTLYDNAKNASCYWPRLPVVASNSLPPITSSLLYPHDKLDKLSQLLTENDFSSAKQIIGELFDITNHYTAGKRNLTDFFVQCVLIDALTILTNYMNVSYVKFYDYSDLYFETLYYCRSCPYREKAQEIECNFVKLVDFCEQAITEKTISSAPLIALIEEFYCRPDFSISVLADEFHVSIAHMSHLVKKELNVNFSDYLWMLRQKKAQELLRTTNLSIDEISVAVGYLNTSSFRRKFKQETGFTPSQFRNGLTENIDHHSD